MITLNTAGNGLWSNESQAVSIVNIELGTATLWEGDPPDELFGELRVYFNPETWDVRELGLIYTDKRFLAELRAFLNSHGLPGADVCYSEQGMQGDDYVSLDAGGKFYAAWMEKFGIEFKDIVEVY